jgi:site-specific DNA recombinase
MGLVPYRGVIYPGKHEPLTTPETWHEVQRLLSAKNFAGEKDREHPHYLKGIIYCDQCGARLIVCHAKGRGGTYPYFICIGRQRDKTSCKQRAIRIEIAEAAIVAYYATVQLPEAEIARLRTFLGDELDKLRKNAERERVAQARRLGQLEDERKKLLDAHYADAIPLDLLKSEQDRLTAEIANAEGRLAEVEGDFKKAEANLARALTRAGDCAAAYREANDQLRRQFNMAFFKRLWLSDEGEVTAELTPLFRALLSEELRRATVSQAEHELEDAIDDVLQERETHNEQRPQEPNLAPVGAEPPALAGRGGFSPTMMVRPSGLEPPRAVKPTRPSTLFACAICVRPRPDRPFCTVCGRIGRI